MSIMVLECYNDIGEFASHENHASLTVDSSSGLFNSMIDFVADDTNPDDPLLYEGMLRVSSPILLTDEKILHVFKSRRDRIVYTNKRFILIDVKGISGRKVQYLSVPNKYFKSFAVETCGAALDNEAEVYLYTECALGQLQQDISVHYFDIMKMHQVLTQQLLFYDTFYETAPTAIKVTQITTPTIQGLPPLASASASAPIVRVTAVNINTVPTAISEKSITTTTIQGLPSSASASIVRVTAVSNNTAPTAVRVKAIPAPTKQGQPSSAPASAPIVRVTAVSNNTAPTAIRVKAISTSTIQGLPSSTSTSTSTSTSASASVSIVRVRAVSVNTTVTTATATCEDDAHHKF